MRLSRRWSLKSSLAPSLFYLGWLHALAGREHDAARCLTEAMHIAEEHGHVHFFSQEAKVARAHPGAVRPARRPGLSCAARSFLCFPPVSPRYFEDLAKGKTYPTDVPLGLAPAPRPCGRAARCRSPGTRWTRPRWKASKRSPTGSARSSR